MVVFDDFDGLVGLVICDVALGGKLFTLCTSGIKTSGIAACRPDHTINTVIANDGIHFVRVTFGEVQ